MIIAKKCFFTKLGLLILVIFVQHSHASDSQIFDRLTKLTNGSVSGAAAIVGVCALFYSLYRKKTADPKTLITSDEQATAYFESHSFDTEDLFWLIKQGYINTFSNLISTISPSDLVKIRHKIGFDLFYQAILQEKYDFAKLIFAKIKANNTLKYRVVLSDFDPEDKSITAIFEDDITFLVALIEKARLGSEFSKNRLLFILEKHPEYLNQLKMNPKYKDRFLLLLNELEDENLKIKIIKKVNDATKL